MKLSRIFQTANSRMTPIAALCVTLASFIFAAPVSIQIPQVAMSLSPQEREAQAEKFVAEKLQVWQQRLNLTKWNIRANLVRSHSLKPKTLGGIRWDADVMKATIDVLSSYDYRLP